MTQTNVEYSRPVPTEWTELVEVAEMATAGHENEEPSFDTLEPVLEAAQGIDDEAFDDARFHGIGLVMCGVARTLQDPEKRHGLVERCAENLVRYRRVDGLQVIRSLCLNNIRSYYMDWPYRTVAENAAVELPMAQQLAADALTVDDWRRESTARDGKPSTQSRDYIARNFRHATAKDVGKNTVAAATGVLRTAANKLYAHNNPSSKELLSAKQESFMPTFHALNEQRSNLNLIAQRCAVLRQDEFLTQLEELIDVSPKGVLIFRRDLMVPSRDLQPPALPEDIHGPIVLHKKRLKCPAIFVGALIPTVVDILFETITEAQKKVAVEHFSWEQ